jgi:hypothetical protein
MCREVREQVQELDWATEMGSVQDWVEVTEPDQDSGVELEMEGAQEGVQAEGQEEEQDWV